MISSSCCGASRSGRRRTRPFRRGRRAAGTRRRRHAVADRGPRAGEPLVAALRHRHHRRPGRRCRARRVPAAGTGRTPAAAEPAPVGSRDGIGRGICLGLRHARADARRPHRTHPGRARGNLGPRECPDPSVHRRGAGARPGGGRRQSGVVGRRQRARLADRIAVDVPVAGVAPGIRAAGGVDRDVRRCRHADGADRRSRDRHRPADSRRRGVAVIAPG